MKVRDFLQTHPVFRIEEFRAFRDGTGSRNQRTHKAILYHYMKTGRLVRVRSHVYAVVPYGQSPQDVQPDPFIIASRITSDSVLAYHTALEVYGKAYSSSRDFLFLTQEGVRLAMFKNYRFRGLSVPSALVRQGCEQFGVVTVDRFGLSIKVTSLERTLVDVLARPGLGGGWEEIWRSLEMVEHLDLDQVVNYALLLGKAAKIARVGFYLEQHAQRLMVDDTNLEKLRAHAPKVPIYFDRRLADDVRLLPRWNLIVPQHILNRAREEPR